MQYPKLASAGMNPVAIKVIQTSQDWSLPIKTVRRGSTGIGATLEHACKISENNSKKADLLGVELKGKRIDGDSRLTLVTKAPFSPFRIGKNGLPTKQKVSTNRTICEKYGYQTVAHDGDRISYHKTILCGQGGYALVRHEDRMVLTLDGEELCHWLKTDFKDPIEKLTNLALIDAKSRGSGDNEEFLYRGINYYYGLDPEKFLQAITDGRIAIEFRIHILLLSDGKRKPRDHGTAFRCDPSVLSSLYDGHKQIPLQTGAA